MTAQSGHVKSVRSPADVSHDALPDLPDKSSLGQSPSVAQETDNHTTHMLT